MMAAGEEKNEYVIAISQNIIKHTNTHTHKYQPNIWA
jgi:hypothetical protein